SRVELQLHNKNGKPVTLSPSNFIIDDIKANTYRNDTLHVHVNDPEQWNPEHPYLYTLIIKLIVSGRQVVLYHQHIGFRQIEIRGNRVFVNGHPIKLHGVCRHSIYPFTGRSVSPALALKDAELFRDGNCNYIRTSHYPTSEAFLNDCDSLGLFVESESSLCWIDHPASPIWEIWNYLDPKFLPYMVNANVEKMVADRNHPAVIIWSLGNESRWSPLWVKVNKIVKQLDPSRPTAFQDQCWGGYNNAGSKCDIANYHYPGFNGPAACDTMKRPTQFDEYAHIENYNRREVLTDPYVRVDWGPSLERMYDSMYAHPANLGGAIWAGINDIFDMPGGQISGYGPWGVIDGWRRKKPEYYAMKKAYAPVIIEDANHPLYEHGKMILRVQNRYDFTNLSAVKISYKTGHHAGMIKADIAPHREGDIEIPVSEKQLQKHSLLLTFTDPRGFICQQEIISSGKENISKPITENAKVVLSESGNAYFVKIKNANYQISKSNGQIDKATISGINVIEQAPVLMIVPLNHDEGTLKGIGGPYYQRNIKPLLYQGCHH
ncbi:MAG: glycoside hydrolase family 2 TIM barrel-domain containing protein, partial [Chitinophagaceae bacterium]